MRRTAHSQLGRAGTAKGRLALALVAAAILLPALPGCATHQLPPAATPAERVEAATSDFETAAVVVEIWLDLSNVSPERRAEVTKTLTASRAAVTSLTAAYSGGSIDLATLLRSIRAATAELRDTHSDAAQVDPGARRPRAAPAPGGAP